MARSKEASEPGRWASFFHGGKRTEYVIYLFVILAVYAAPLVSTLVKSTTDEHFFYSWHDILDVWAVTSVFVAAIAIHNFLLAPLLIYRNNLWGYLAGLICLVGVFQLYQCSHRPKDMPSPGMHKVMREYAKEHPSDAFDVQAMPPGPPGGKNKRPPLDMHDIMAFILLTMAAGTNLGIKAYFKSDEERKKLQALEKENLAIQLQHLKYQVNPHFLMNTLNNIHALVDLEPEKAKESIVKLSQLLRYVIYEGEKQYITLQSEISFLKNFIEMMRLRYTSNLTVHATFPEHLPDRVIPPLLFVEFLGNAFKHGVSYAHHSTIDVLVEIDNAGKVLFTCSNSKPPQPVARIQNRGGMGLANLKQRLDLTYGDNYTLDVSDNGALYTVRLSIPSEDKRHLSPNHSS